MKSRHPVFTVVMFFAVLVALSQAQTGVLSPGVTAEKKTNDGVVVEQVAKNSEGEKASLHPGDIILRWTRGNANGKVETPFDLSWVEAEQVQRGRVTLEGLRNNQKLTWNLGPAHWDVKARPNLQEPLLSIYHEGQDLAETGKLAKAMEHWQRVAAQAQQSQPGWVSAWLFFQQAEALASARQWKEADSAYQKALDASPGQPAIAQILRRRARVFQSQNDWNNAEKYYRQAIAEAEKVRPGSLFIATCLNNLGVLFATGGKMDMAEEQFVRSLAIRQKLAPDSLDEAESLDDLGIVEGQRGNLQKAEEYSRKAVAITERLIPESIDLAISLNNLGYIMIRKGDLDASASFFERALALEEKLEPEQLATASTLTNLGTIAREQGNLRKAESYHRRSLDIRQKISPRGIDYSAGLNNLAMIYTERGDLIEAEKLYLQAVAILEKIAPRSHNMSVALTNLGDLNHYRGDVDMAGEYFRRALAIAEKIGSNGMDVAGLLGNLGSIAQEQGNPTAASEYFHRALSISEKVAPDSLDTAETLNKLGSFEQEQNANQQAREYYERALQIEEKVAPHGPLAALSLNSLGDLSARENDLSKAEANYRRALEIREKLSLKHTEYAESLASLASLLHRKGQTEEAAKLFAQALDAFESQLAVLGGGEDISSGFRARHIDYYKEYIDLLVQQKQPELAFQILERLRARELLKVLTAHVDLSKGGAASLLAQQRALAADLAAKSNRRIVLLNDEHTEEKISAFDKEIHTLETQLEELNSQIGKSNPDYAALTQPKPLSVKEVQEHLLDADTALLAYDLGEERSYLWLVTSDSSTTYELPKRSEIEAAARKLRTILTARNNGSKNETDVGRLARAKGADAAFPAAAARLSRTILNAPASRLKHKRLFVVSDGILQYIPFAVLPVPGSSTPFMRNHEVVNLPSASVLAVLKAQTAGRAPAAKAVAVLADPVFDVNDARVRTAQASLRKQVVAEQVRTKTEDSLVSDTHGKPLFLRSASEIGVIKGGASFPRLVFARAEAEAILQGIPAGQSLKALDFKASRATAASQDLYDYRVVHFATHGLLNSEHPELSGLVLSLVDEHGKEQNGFLGLKDIYNLNLRADLVVLSACETGLGKEVQGEGLVGVARGFMYAGASSVVASLWKVDDLATAEFMKVFYKAMLNDKMRPAAALRYAQIAMSKRWTAPYFWAGFVLQGQP